MKEISVGSNLCQCPVSWILDQLSLPVSCTYWEILFFVFCQLVPPPEFIAQREKLWQELKADYDKWVAAQPQDPIKVTLPDGKQVEGQAWKTTPYQVAEGIRYPTYYWVPSKATDDHGLLK